MQITKNKIEDKTLISIEGEVDLNTSPLLRKAFQELITAQVKHVIINFEKVTYIDSSGLATLIEMQQSLKKNQGKIVLLNVASKIRSIFEITRIDKLFSIYASKEDAVASF